jgi:hypothetical protein
MIPKLAQVIHDLVAKSLGFDGLAIVMLQENQRRGNDHLKHERNAQKN